VRGVGNLAKIGFVFFWRGGGGVGVGGAERQRGGEEKEGDDFFSWQ